MSVLNDYDCNRRFSMLTTVDAQDMIDAAVPFIGYRRIAWVQEIVTIACVKAVSEVFHEIEQSENGCVSIEKNAACAFAFQYAAEQLFLTFDFSKLDNEIALIERGASK